MERNAAAHLIRLCAIVYMEIATVSFLPWLLWAQGSNLAKLNFGPCGTLDSSLNLVVGQTEWWPFCQQGNTYDCNLSVYQVRT